MPPLLTFSQKYPGVHFALHTGVTFYIPQIFVITANRQGSTANAST